MKNIEKALIEWLYRNARLSDPAGKWIYPGSYMLERKEWRACCTMIDSTALNTNPNGYDHLLSVEHVASLYNIDPFDLEVLLRLFKEVLKECLKNGAGN